MATLDNSMNSVYMQQGAQSGPWWGAGDATTYGTPVGGSFLNTSGKGYGGEQDPDLTAAMRYLRSVMEGDNVPFTDAVKAQMLGQQSSMNAAAEAGQNAALQRSAAVGGASGNDPSLRGAVRQSMAARQGANTTAAGTINTQATLANARAKNTAGQQLAGWGNARESRNKAQDASQYSAAQLFSGSDQSGSAGRGGSFTGMSEGNMVGGGATGAWDRSNYLQQQRNNAAWARQVTAARA